MTDEMTAERIKEALDLLMKGGTFGDLHGFKPEDIEAVYSVGFASYQAGKFDEAETVFRFAVFYNHLEPKYLLALGAAQQAQRKYEEAIKTYAGIALIDLHEIRAYYHIAECLLALERRDEAVDMLKEAVRLAKPETENGREYKAKAEEKIKGLKG